MGKSYKIFGTADKFAGREGEIFTEEVHDEETQESFEAKIMVSSVPREGYCPLTFESSRGGVILQGDWYVKIIGREAEEEEEVTVFEETRLGARKGYMLRSMTAEQKTKLKQEIMSSELEKRLKRKQELVKDILKKSE